MNGVGAQESRAATVSAVERATSMGGRDRRRDAAALCGVGLFARIGVVFWGRGRFPPAEDGHYYDVLARRIAEGHGYTWLWPDGAVTPVAHYPVGYPAILALVYSIFGASVGVAMATNAVLGAASVYGVHRLVDGQGVPRWRPNAAALALALHPALVAYTAAVMTEGVTAALLVVAASVAAAAQARPWRWWLLGGAGLVMGVATLVRPQSLALAPILGACSLSPALSPAAARRSRFGAAAVVAAFALACVLPWTARNCVRMGRCALVSVNGGWNLLIGATSPSGAWQPLTVPDDCASVWDEAGKDSCFARTAWREIERAPGRWVLRSPAKLGATFDYFGAAPWYLHASNGAAFGDRAKALLGGVETAVSRLLLVAALFACALLEGARSTARKVVAAFGAVASVTVHGWLGYLALPWIVALAGPRAIARMPAVVPMAAAVVAVTAATHAVFFGAGRYGLVVAPFVAALAFVGRGRPS